MPLSLKPLNQQTIVITGATSGIGLATALAAAEKGANLVLAARNSPVLTDVERQIRERNPQAQVLSITADVGNKDDIESICSAAIAKFGTIDTWVNNAGVSIYGQLQEVTDEDHRRLFDTNFWGIVYGSLAAARHLKEKGGTIINIGSELSEHGITLQGMYAASKHAVKGFTDSLRMELEEEGAPISVTLIKPAAIATPYAQHVKNYLDKAPKLPQPIYAPEEVAYAILHAATTPTRDVFVGGGAKAMSLASKLAPRLFDWISEKLMTPAQQSNERKHGQTPGLYEAASTGQTRGQDMGYVMEKSLYTRASLHPLATALIAAGIGVGIFAAFMRPEPAYKRYRRKLQQMRRHHIPDLSRRISQLRETFH